MKSRWNALVAGGCNALGLALLALSVTAGGSAVRAAGDSVVLDSAALEPLMKLADVFQQRVAKIEASVTALADSLTTRRIAARELCVADENGAETCITKAQLDALLKGAMQTAAASASAPAAKPAVAEAGDEPAPQPAPAAETAARAPAACPEKCIAPEAAAGAAAAETAPVAAETSAHGETAAPAVTDALVVKDQAPETAGAAVKETQPEISVAAVKEAPASAATDNSAPQSAIPPIETPAALADAVIPAPHSGPESETVVVTAAKPDLVPAEAPAKQDAAQAAPASAGARSQEPESKTDPAEAAAEPEQKE